VSERPGKPMQAWPFDFWLKTAVRGFGLTPADFWDMSVRDWLALLSGEGAQGLARTDLSILMNTYPDEVSYD